MNNSPCKTLVAFMLSGIYKENTFLRPVRQFVSFLRAKEKKTDTTRMKGKYGLKL
jgi:hypothetical protein